MEGEVAVTVKPLKIARGENTIFLVSLETHTVELDKDLKNVSVMRDDKGKEYKPTNWTGGQGGHHVSGNLVFPPISKDTKSTPETKIQAESLFQAAESWGIFAKEGGTEIKDLITAGITSILDTSVYSSIGSFNVRALVISLVCRKIFTSRVDARKKEEISSIQHGQDYLSYKNTRDDPLVWIFVDECHEFLPRIGKTPATDALIQLLREGRQPGISLVMATQQPGQIHMDAMTQSDIVIAHRVTARPDIEALNEIMQTYLLENIKQAIDDLPSLKGSAIVLDDNSERIYPIRVRPRYTWHGGEAPSAVKTEINL